jgi:predicted peptidase
MNVRFLLVFGALLLIITLLVSSISFQESKKQTGRKKELFQVELQKHVWFDSIRGREIPVAIYFPRNTTPDSMPIKLVVFSHGYGQNYPYNYTNYSYLTEKLASYGFWVMSIQHELKEDPLLPQGTNVYELRKPFWDRGMRNIFFAIEEFKRTFPNKRISEISAVGHSNGGDMSVYAAINRPDLFKNVVTLDHLRVPIPTTISTAIFTLRSSDKIPDSMVIPVNFDASRLVWLKRIKHNDMNDEGSRKQHKEITKHLIRFLRP